VFKYQRRIGDRRCSECLNNPLVPPLRAPSKCRTAKIANVAVPVFGVTSSEAGRNSRGDFSAGAGAPRRRPT
jgi:hypothetical protein